ncbi:hypothetical protein JKA33_02195 [Klebsiella quasipneumoniae]|uniref:hypothetical protein n=1 Tax=Klebsiella quasipneumoniae TaxID=1463165 RepID=UPI0002C41D27|nr:hypothetical protein [Klebsiella quasipneumoniae]AMR14953.1 hypothetical protein AVR78_11570 [Klebsiella quasipneumoniae]AVF88319.1 hypothetical protein AL473_11530 [Klebsiella quasipneumoniae]AWO60159.1 hypothetical protein DLJ73_03445 [Klebsiella quasipneumoniae subsp. similipneumoniae]EMR23233.1 lipoprotein [Klebsiella quasipneumoniae]MBK5761662.1 hypothetical protein [Klebsiella quasipneumoniae]
MRIFGLIVIAVLLVACGVIHPFGDKTIYQTYSVPDRLGLHWRYDCIRSALKPQGYEVERIIPEQNAPNFFDISQHGTRVAQIDMYQVAGARTISITLISGAKQVSAAIDSIIQPCLDR